MTVCTRACHWCLPFRQMNLVRTVIHGFFEIHVNIILLSTPTLPASSLPFRFLNWMFFMYFSSLLFVLHAPSFFTCNFYIFCCISLKFETSFILWINFPTWCNIYCIISARHVSGLHAHLQEQVDVIISYIYSIWCPWCSRCRSWGECVMVVWLLKADT